MLKSVVRVAGAAVRLSSAAPGVSARVLPLSCPMLRNPCSATARPFTRSLWMLSNNGASSDYRPKLFSSKVSFPSCGCGCGGLHTKGDKAFDDFLSDEIKEEKKIQKNKNLPKMSGGWELELNGTEAKLTKHVSGDKVTVTFNVNDSIPTNPTNFEDEEEHGQSEKSAEEVEEPEILSTPNFVVEVTKIDGKHSLVFDCQFPEDEIGRGEDEDEESDIFSIRGVSFQPEGDIDWKETSYTLNTDSLDWALYDHLMDFLADRGIDNTFADELCELSTSIEHQAYIKFLENLQGFVKCK